jgi:hypothetical protein
MRRILAAFAILGSLAAGLLPMGRGHPSDSREFLLASPAGAAGVYVDAGDWPVARIAARDLAADIERVAGRKPAVTSDAAALPESAVLIGTLGRSPLIDRLAADGRIDVGDAQGQWETAVIAAVERPLPGVKRGLVIAGSDRRGTAYGVYELSRRIGVSPWVWWADVTPARRETLRVPGERIKIGPPAVKYRGIFINDEMWSIRPWAAETFAPEEGMGLGPRTYAKVFELLLRLRANYLWPAMMDGTKPFNAYPENKAVADEYGIVMGSSHIEPLLRNNIVGAEWDREGGGAWNYLTNAPAIRDYWARRLEANGRYENVYTLGMRGQDDEPMQGGATVPEKIALMERIFADQRGLLARLVNPDLARVPQVFIPYAEVLGLYDAGMKVPDDVIICWPDDDFGYIRRLPTEAERTRPGGSGVYYHIEWLNGATTAYTWLNTTPPALIWEEMNKAWEYGARTLWVLNVGGMKPREIGTEFFLDLAWNPRGRGPDAARRFLEQWAARDIDTGLAPEIAAILDEYFRLGFARRPEHLVQYRAGTLSYSWFDHDSDEARRRLDRYADIARRAQAVYDRLPRERRDAFFEFVLYPVQAAALMNEKVICADRSGHDAALGRSCAGEYARRARDAAERIVRLTEHYNTGLVLAGAKWNRMMRPAPGPWGDQYYQFIMPALSDFAGDGPPALDVAAEGGGEALAELSVYARGRRFIDLFNNGRGSIDWTATASAPWVKFDPSHGRFTTEQRLWVSVDWSLAPKGREVGATVDISSTGGDRRIVVPVFNPSTPAREAAAGFVESDGCVSMEAGHVSRVRDRGGAGWRIVEGLGRSGRAVTVLPPTIPSRATADEIAAGSPSLEYDLYLFDAGEARLDLDCLPTQPVAPGRGVRLAVSFDDGPPEIVAGKGGDVLANLRRLTAKVRVAAPGPHRLIVWMADPGVVLDKIVLSFRPQPSTYMGPPESYRAGRDVGR